MMEKKKLKAKGILATCIQHEIDHLEGILFIDYLSKLKKDMIIKKLVKQKKEINKIVLRSMALKIIFMGTPDFAVPILQSINNSKHNILAVYTQPPKKKNRGQKEKNSSVHSFSEKDKIKIRYPEKLDTIEEVNFLKEKPDVVVVAAYGKIIPKNILKHQEY